MIDILADLHVHTALSPCADDAMTPPAIVAGALAEGLAMIAICDHNSARNVAAVQAAADARLTVVAGMEITSVEECHVLGLFPHAAAAETAGAEVTALLPEAGDGYIEFFGEQHVLDAHGDIVARETRALATATPLGVTACVDLVHRHGGLAVAAHVDRPSFSVISQLGVFPRDARFDAVEVSRHVASGSEAEARFRAFGLPVVRSSDGHYLSDLGAAGTRLTVAEATFAELTLALRADGGRGVADA
ncbi:MAG TPA: PHP domain-containing protein [Thermoleophilia bacterium]|nr:PHP domain-containing protein [Thermoleophilia bacterium]HQG03451.1 PHP domain-containing protein [Thermoleophilia bacterium]HQG54585.1 PHP domain-containing protein [Thermoleophilia bacterium]HQJ97220.1 PHP domain-containing protein [Thermoleophilia bacterium]